MKQTFADPFSCYEAIGSFLTGSAPEPWERIIVDFEILEIDDVSEDCIVYEPSKGRIKEKQFFINDTNFAGCFFQLARLVSTPEKGLFKKCHFVLEKDGTYKVEFTY